MCSPVFFGYSQYLIEQSVQNKHVLAIVRQLAIVPGGTQLETIRKLSACAYFFEESGGDVSFLIGEHGSGRTSMIAQMLWNMDLVFDKESIGEAEMDTQNTGPSKLQAKVLGLKVLMKFGSADLKQQSDQTREEMCTRNRGRGKFDNTGEVFSGLHGLKKEDQEKEEAAFQDRLAEAEKRMNENGAKVAICAFDLVEKQHNYTYLRVTTMLANIVLYERADPFRA